MHVHVPVAVAVRHCLISCWQCPTVSTQPVSVTPVVSSPASAIGPYHPQEPRMHEHHQRQMMHGRQQPRIRVSVRMMGSTCKHSLTTARRRDQANRLKILLLILYKSTSSQQHHNLTTKHLRASPRRNRRDLDPARDMHSSRHSEGEQGGGGHSP